MIVIPMEEGWRGGLPDFVPVYVWTMVILLLYHPYILLMSDWWRKRITRFCTNICTMVIHLLFQSKWRRRITRFWTSVRATVILLLHSDQWRRRITRFCTSVCMVILLLCHPYIVLECSHKHTDCRRCPSVRHRCAMYCKVQIGVRAEVHSNSDSIVSFFLADLPLS
jgi:hypothetical protein